MACWLPTPPAGMVPEVVGAEAWACFRVLPGMASLEEAEISTDSEPVEASWKEKEGHTLSAWDANPQPCKQCLRNESFA